MYFLEALIHFYNRWRTIGAEGISSEDQGYLVLSFKHAASTPVTILLACIEELKKSYPSGAENVVSKSYAAVRTLQQLLQHFDAPVHGSPSCKVLDILSDIKKLLETDGKRVSVVPLSGTDRLCVFAVNRVRLREALLCLIKNALEASSVTPVVILCGEKKDEVLVSIRDFGAGLNFWQRTITRIPFISFKKNGSGIGLSFARQVIVKELGGTVHLSSVVGNGTTLECSIPKQRPARTRTLFL